MLTILITYLSVGWLVASIASCVLMVRNGAAEGYDTGDFLRIIPLWPVLPLVGLYMLIVRMIEWGLDD